MNNRGENENCTCLEFKDTKRIKIIEVKNKYILDYEPWESLTLKPKTIHHGFPKLDRKQAFPNFLKEYPFFHPKKYPKLQKSFKIVKFRYI